MAKNGGTLCLHAGAKRVTLKELAAAPVPPQTQTYKPIPHGELVKLVKTNVTKMGFKVVAEEYAGFDTNVKLDTGRLDLPNGRMFGLLHVQHPDLGNRDDFNVFLGLRNGHDKKLSELICAGTRVFICDNMAVNADFKLVDTHHPGIVAKLPSKVEEFLAGFLGMAQSQCKVLDAYKEVPMSDMQFHDLAVRSALDDGPMASSHVIDLVQEWRCPRHEEFKPRNLWSAFNAFTEVSKKYGVMTAPERTKSIHALCNQIAFGTTEPQLN